MFTKQEILEKGLISNYNFIKQTFTDKKLYINSTPLTEETFEQLRQICNSLNIIFENNWDFDFDLDINKTWDINMISIRGIKIHFDKIKISNTKQDTHNILDLFVVIDISVTEENKIYFPNIMGFRTTLSFIEYQNCYEHSHLTDFYKDAITSPKKFCLGSGEIKVLQSLIQHEDFNIDTIRNFFVQLFSLVSHESLEGKPYKFIAELKLKYQYRKFYSTPSTRQLKNLADIFILYLKSNNKELHFKIKAGKFEVLEISLFEHIVDWVYNSNTPTEHRKFILSYKVGSDYFEHGSEMAVLEIDPPVDKHIYFRGKKIDFKIVDEPERKTNQEPDYIIHPRIIEYFMNHLTKTVNEKSIRNSIYERYKNKNNNALEGITSDSTSM
jgi:hypothetical protein